MSADTKTWPELAVGLYDVLTGRHAEITYEFEKMQIGIPSSASDQATHAQWHLNGTIKIRTQDDANS